MTQDEIKPGPRLPLTRDRVLLTAVELADQGGIDSISMRKLGQMLGVEAMSLYHHVANKGDLVDAIVDLVLEDIELPSSTKDWETAIRDYAVSAHTAFLRHPWACGLVMSPSSKQTMRTPLMRKMEWLLNQLSEAGFSPDVTYHAYHAIDSHILGFTMWQLGHSAGTNNIRGAQSFREFVAGFVVQLRAEGFPSIATHAEQHVSAPHDESNREFEFGLDLILQGLKRLQERPSDLT